jgi:hypothetical protein
MKHSPLYIPTDGTQHVSRSGHCVRGVVIDGTASGTLTACVEYVCSVRTPAVALCLDHGAPLVMVPAFPVIDAHASGTLSHCTHSNTCTRTHSALRKLLHGLSRHVCRVCP